MSDDAAVKTPTARKFEVAKMFAYFILLFIGMRILREIFKEISGTTYFAELSRLSGLAASAFETTKNLDELIITFITLTMALLLVLPLAWVHMITNAGKNNESLTQTLITLSVIVAGVMLLLQDNLARSFSLVGVVGAVRYRNTLKDPKDAVFVFLSIGIGMACGLQASRVAVLLSVFECIILLVLWVYHTGRPVVAEAALLDTLKGAENRGDRTPAQALAWLSPEARDRLDADLESQSRYIHLAARFATKKGKKKPNSVIVVQLASGSPHEQLTRDIEEHHGAWRLLGLEERGGVTSLEYLGRVPRKEMPPLHFLERLRKANAGVQHIAFHSLRKMIAENAAVSQSDGDAQRKATEADEQAMLAVPSVTEIVEELAGSADATALEKKRQ